MRAYVIKKGKKYLNELEEYGSLNKAILFPTRKEAQREIDKEIDWNEIVVPVDIKEVK